MNTSQLEINEEIQISVYDVTGKILIEKKLTFVDDSINLKKYNKGVYFLKIQSDNQSIVKKLIFI